MKDYAKLQSNLLNTDTLPELLKQTTGIKASLLPDEFWHQPTLRIAQLLPGRILIRILEGEILAGRIVETEAYVQDDPASHSYKRKTPRNAAMFGPAGTAYVYFTYGNHFCLNFVTADEGLGEAVLIRAMEPLCGLDAMARLRGRHAPKDLMSGPGKLCQAMAIGREFNRHDLSVPPLLLMQDGWQAGKLTQSTRIGISVSQEKLWRFYPERSIEWVSRK